MRHDLYVPLWQRYTLTIKEASRYFSIGESRLRALVKQAPTADYIVWNGSKALIIRKAFEDYLSASVSIQ